MLSTSAKIAALPVDIMNKIFLEHWLNKYEEQAEKIDAHLRQIYQMGRDMYRLEDAAFHEERRLGKKLHATDSNLSQAEYTQTLDRIWKFKEKAKDFGRKILVAKGEIEGLINAREKIERKIIYFTNVTTEFEIRNQRMTKIRARELCERYE